MEWRFCICCRLHRSRAKHLGIAATGTSGNIDTCQPERLAVVSELPIKRLTRATRTGQSALAAEQGPSAAISNHGRATAAEIPIGKATPEEYADRTGPQPRMTEPYVFDRGICAVAGYGAIQPEIKTYWVNQRHTGIEAERSFGRGNRGLRIVTEPESGGLLRESATSNRNRVSQQRNSKRLDTKAEESNPMEQKAKSQEVHA
jgi:hypothetical protein